MLISLLAAVLALIVSLVCTPVVKRLAIKLKILDKPNNRNVHDSQIPKLGGISVFVGFLTGFVFFAILSGWHAQYVALVGACGAILILGFFDDLLGLSCYRKLAIESVFACLMIFAGFQIERIYIPYGSPIELGILSIPITVLWIVGLTNAINLLDGLDGLAAGYTIITGVVLIIVAGFSQNAAITTLALLSVMASLGFLKYNLPPAKIFMGDTGSLFLGFFIACLSIEAFSSAFQGLHVSALFVCFSLPIVDTTLAIIRRLSLKKHPFSPDNQHIHHRLLKASQSPFSALFFIYMITFLTGALAIVLLSAGANLTTFLLSGLGLFFLMMLQHLGCFDFLIRAKIRESEAK